MIIRTQDRRTLIVCDDDVLIELLERGNEKVDVMLTLYGFDAKTLGSYESFDTAQSVLDFIAESLVKEESQDKVICMPAQDEIDNVSDISEALDLLINCLSQGGGRRRCAAKIKKHAQL